MNTNSRTLSATLGGSPELALFEAFAFRNDTPLSPAQASRFSGVAWATAHRKIIQWEVNGILSRVGKEGKSNLYVLNSNSETVNILSKAVRTAVIELFESEDIESPSSEVLYYSKVPSQSFETKGQVGDMKWTNPVRIMVSPS